MFLFNVHCYSTCYEVSQCLKYAKIFRNPRVPCRSIADLDISHWREEVTQCRVNGINIALGSSKKISPCTSCTCTKDGVRSERIDSTKLKKDIIK